MRSRAPYSGVLALLLAWVVLAVVFGALLLGAAWGLGWLVANYY